MNAFAQVLALVAAAVGVSAWALESVFFSRPAVHRRIFHTPTEDLRAVRLWRVNQGFYNLFLAAGTFAGLAALRAGHDDAGRALVIYTCLFMAACGVTLGLSDRRHLDGAIGQAAAPIAALVAALW